MNARPINMVIAAWALAAAMMFPFSVRAGEAEDWLALADAAGKGDLKTVKELLARGAKPNVPHPAYENRFSPLDVAVGEGHITVATLLLAHHADINDADNVGGYTPLMVVANSGRADGAKFLLKRGAKINLKDKKGETALDWALFTKQGNHLRVVQLLLDHGALAGAGVAVEVQTPAQSSPGASATTASAGENATFAYCKGFWNEDLGAEYFSGVFPVFGDGETELAKFKAFMTSQYRFSVFHAGECLNEFSSEAEAEMYRSRKMNSLRAKASSGERIVDTGWRP